jgi:hypothetical protein
MYAQAMYARLASASKVNQRRPDLAVHSKQKKSRLCLGMAPGAAILKPKRPVL